MIRRGCVGVNIIQAIGRVIDKGCTCVRQLSGASGIDICQAVLALARQATKQNYTYDQPQGRRTTGALAGAKKTFEGVRLEELLGNTSGGFYKVSHEGNGQAMHLACVVWHTPCRAYEKSESRYDAIIARLRIIVKNRHISPCEPAVNKLQYFFCSDVIGRASRAISALSITKESVFFGVRYQSPRPE